MTKKILVVDDSPMMVKMVRDQLEHKGFQVNTAQDGLACIRTAEEWNPDLILMDVMMPEMDGYEACARLRSMEATAHIPIMMLTAKATVADKAKGFEAGADDYLTKPFDAAELGLRISALFRRTERLTRDDAPEQGRVISVFTLRGGAGSSSLAVNLAVGLSRLWNEPVPLVDLSLPVGVCDAMVNLQPRNRLDDLVGHTLADLDGDMIDGYLTVHENGIRLLGGFLEPVNAESLTEKHVAFILEHLRQRYNHVVLDLGHDFSPPTVAALDWSDKTLMPITPDFNSARLAQVSLGVFESLGYDHDPDIIINWTFGQKGISRKQLEGYLKSPVRFVIPHSEGLWSEAINSGVPLITSDPSSPLVALLEDMAWKMSKPEHKVRKPGSPSEMWDRINQRMEKRKKGAKAKP